MIDSIGSSVSFIYLSQGADSLEDRIPGKVIKKYPSGSLAAVDGGIQVIFETGLPPRAILVAILTASSNVSWFISAVPPILRSF